MADNVTRRPAFTRRRDESPRRVHGRLTREQSATGNRDEDLAFYRFLLDRDFYGVPLDELAPRRPR